MNYSVSCLWPWDILSWLWDQGHFLQWVCDEKEKASEMVADYWRHCQGQDFFRRLELPESQWATCVPLFWHTDGVKIYRNQKSWVYSYASACRKGVSTQTKLVLLLLREATIIKDKSHDRVGEIIGYITKVLMSGQFPHTNEDGEPFPMGSREQSRAGAHFAGGWTLAFAGFKGDWEARQVIHKSTRFYNANYICEHCLASRDPNFTFGDLRMSANCLSVRFTHEQYIIMQGDRLSSWRHVKGWTKDRNLEERCL